MKCKGVVIALIVSLGLNLGAAGIFAFRTFSKPKLEHPGNFFKQTLNLSEEQIDSIASMRKSSGKEMDPIRNELDDKRTRILTLLKEPELDSIQVDILFAQISDLQAQMEKKMFMDLYQTKEILTPEQQVIFLEMVENNMLKEGRGGPLPPMMPPDRPKPRPDGDSI